MSSMALEGEEAHRTTGNRPSATPWAAVICLSLLTFVLIASEFLPVSLLTPIAAGLGISEGQAGQAISVSGFFAVVTSLFGNSLLSTWDRRSVTMFYTTVLVASGLAITSAPNYLSFMAGRALIGVSIGGFWSISTAILGRLVPAPDLPKALAMLQGGTAFASVIAAPLGSFLGGLIGWRGAFFSVVPIGIAGLLWQWAVLPQIPSDGIVKVSGMTALLRNRTVALGMAATTLAFMGQFSLQTYLRPFLEQVTGVDTNTLSLFLLGLGVAGLIGTSLIGFALGSHLKLALIGLPASLALLAILLMGLGPFAIATAALLFLWGLLTTPIPVAWGTWMTQVIPNDLEAGGGLQVALVQTAITCGAFSGGLLFDHAGWWSPFILAAVLLTGSALLAGLATSRSTKKGTSL